MKKILLFIIIFIGLMATANALEASDQLAGLLNNLVSMQGQFKQTITTAQDEMQQSNGKFALQRPGKFLWQVTQPSPQVLVADGKQVWFYDIDLAQVTQQNQASLGISSPAALLSGDTASILKAFTVRTLNKPRSLGDWYLLIPHDKDSLFHSVILNFLNNTLQGMIINDNLGQKTQINFNQVQTNLNLAADLFQFKSPPGVDVLKQG